MIYDVIVVGGGPCGVMTCIQAKNKGLNVLLLEHNQSLLNKLKVSGNGRCNITNNKNTKEFMKNVFDNPKFMYKVVNSFNPSMIIDYFNSLEVELKEEDHNRMFPVSNDATTISDALIKQLDNVTVKNRMHVAEIKKEDDIFKVYTNNTFYQGHKLVIATGGATYPELGCDKSGYEILKSMNLQINDLVPQECPVEVINPLTQFQGVSFKDITINVKDSNNKIYFTYQHDVLITHFGLSGPGILNTSFALNDLIKQNKKAYISLNLINKSYEQCYEHLQLLIKENPNKLMFNTLDNIPNKIKEYLIKEAGLENIKNSYINKNQLKTLSHLLTDFSFEFKKFFQPEYAFVTGGGLDIKQLKQTLESKEINNLYVGGEILDYCAMLGGYNITCALACGYMIGNSL